MHGVINNFNNDTFDNIIPVVVEKVMSFGGKVLSFLANVKLYHDYLINFRQL